MRMECSEGRTHGSRVSVIKILLSKCEFDEGVLFQLFETRWGHNNHHKVWWNVWSRMVTSGSVCCHTWCSLERNWGKQNPLRSKSCSFGGNTVQKELGLGQEKAGRRKATSYLLQRSTTFIIFKLLRGFSPASSDSRCGWFFSPQTDPTAVVPNLPQPRFHLDNIFTDRLKLL